MCFRWELGLDSGEKGTLEEKERSSKEKQGRKHWIESKIWKEVALTKPISIHETVCHWNKNKITKVNKKILGILYDK